MSDHVLERRSTDWPDPVEIYNEDGSSDIVLLCEHASHHMPSEYGDLGLSSVDRLRHIAWDIGAAEITRGLVKRLNAPAFLSTYSRLLIDLNRPLMRPRVFLSFQKARIFRVISISVRKKSAPRRAHFHSVS